MGKQDSKRDSEKVCSRLSILALFLRACRVGVTLPVPSGGKSEKESLCWLREDLASPSVKLLNLKGEDVKQASAPVLSSSITAHKLQG